MNYGFSQLKRYLKDHVYLLFALFFSAIIACINLYWVLQDIVPPPWDQAWYLETSQNLYHTLTRDGIFKMVWNIQFSLDGIKAPLLCILAVPMYILFGNSELSAMMVNVVFLFLSSFYLFKLTDLLFNSDRAGFLTVLIFQTIPFSYALNRQFFVEYGLTTLVIMFVYYLVQSDSFQNKKCNSILGVVSGLGLLMKVTFPGFILGPVVVILYQRLKLTGFRPEKQLLKELGKVVIVTAFIASVWYARNIYSILRFAWSSGYGSVGAEYGTDNIFDFHAIFKYYKVVIDEVLSSYYTFLLILSGIAIFIISRLKKTALRQKRSIFILVSWVIIPLIFLTLGKVKEVRFIFSLIPVVAIVVSIIWDRLITNKVAFVLVSLVLVLYPVKAMIDLSFFNQNRNILSYFPRIPDKRNWPLNEVIDYVFKGTIADTNNYQYSVIAVEHSIVNANTFSYLAAAKNCHNHFYFISLGYMENDVEKAIQRLNDFKPMYIIFQEGIPAHEISHDFNQCNELVLEKVKRQELQHYALDKEFAFSDGVKLILYKRY